MSETGEYSRRSGVANDHGIKFEWHTTSLAYLRCERLHLDSNQNGDINIKSFLIANNVNDIGIFDDVVVKVEYTEDGVNTKKKVIFVQCKHKEDPNKDVNKILSPKFLKECFHSFASILQILKNDDQGISRINFKNIVKKRISNEIAQNFSKERLENEISDCMARREELKTLLNCDISDCEFLLYTNASTPQSSNNIIREVLNEEEEDEEYDVTSKIFKSIVRGNSSYFKPETLKSLGLSGSILSHVDFNVPKEFQYLWDKFIEKFKIYYRQEIDIEIDIGKLIKRKYLSQNISHENVITEIQHHFSGAMCTVLSDKSNLLPRVENYCKLNAQLSKAKVDSRSYLTSESLFSVAHTTLNNDIKRARENIYRNEKLEKHEMIQLSVYLNMMQREKNLLVFIDNESDMDAWRKARETKTYNNFKDVFIVCSDSLKDFERKENEFIIDIVRPHNADDRDRIGVKRPRRDDEKMVGAAGETGARLAGTGKVDKKGKGKT